MVPPAVWIIFLSARVKFSLVRVISVPPAVGPESGVMVAIVSATTGDGLRKMAKIEDIIANEINVFNLVKKG